MSGDHDKKRIFGILKILGKMSYLLKTKIFLKKMRMNHDFLVYQPDNADLVGN
jgi:hypothetical protein